jgi:hypothetical protein
VSVVQHVPDHHASKNEAGQHGIGLKLTAWSAIEHGRAIMNLAHAGDATVMECEKLHKLIATKYI